jgi:hypothetical protein
VVVVSWLLGLGLASVAAAALASVGGGFAAGASSGIDWAMLFSPVIKPI